MKRVIVGLLMAVLAPVGLSAKEKTEKKEIELNREVASVTSPSKFVDVENGVVCYYIAHQNRGGTSSVGAYGYGYAAINCIKMNNPK